MLADPVMVARSVPNPGGPRMWTIVNSNRPFTTTGGPKHAGRREGGREGGLRAP